ncbi:MAG: hypothetical protein ACFE95_20085 [Candidatus Hodarchaeota archaeon]
MAISKDQVLIQGRFHPDKNTIYLCHVNNAVGLVKDVIIFSILIGFFAFFLMQWFALIIVPLTWPFILWFILPKHYRIIQLKTHVVIFGTGSLVSLIRKMAIISPEKYRYSDISYLRFEKWEKIKRKGKKDSFGRIEVSVGDTKALFSILIQVGDLSQLVKIFEAHRFQTKVQKSRSRGELLLVFPTSPLYNSSY